MVPPLGGTPPAAAAAPRSLGREEPPPLPAGLAGADGSPSRRSTPEESDALAKLFTPPSKLPEMQPCIEVLKEFEEKLDSGVPTGPEEEKRIREVFEKIRSILAQEAEKALEKPAYISAAFMKYHGGHLDAYDVAHNKGSGVDPDHDETVQLARVLKDKAENEHRRVQQSTLSQIILVKQAIELKGYYNTFVNMLAEKCNGELVLPPGKGWKGLYRIIEKSAMRHGEMQNMCNNVFDVLRGMLLFKDDKTLGNALQIMSKEAEIVRVKERLAATSRTSEGWGDIMVNFRLKLPPDASVSVGTADHICEVQFARKKMYDMRSSLGGHDEYVWFRAAEELHTVNSLDLPTTKLSTMISNRITSFQNQRRFSQCGQLQDLRTRAIEVEDNLEVTKDEMKKMLEMGDFNACAQLQERETYFEEKKEKLEQEFNKICG